MIALIAALWLTPPPDTSTASLQQLLTRVVAVGADSGKFLSIDIDTVPSADPAARLVNDHRVAFHYLIVNSMEPWNLFKEVSPLAPPDQRRAIVIRNLLADSAIRTSLIELNGMATGRQLAASHRRSVSAALVQMIAARFFYPRGIADGRIRVSRCEVINGAPDLGPRRDRTVEAFAFEVLSTHRDAQDLNRDFSAATEAVQPIAAQPLSKDAMLATAQRRMYDLMEQSGGLKSVLRAAYVSQQAAWPFQVPEWASK